MADLRVPSAPGARKTRRKAVTKKSRGLSAGDGAIYGLETNRILARDAAAVDPRRRRRGVGGSNAPGTGPEVPADQLFHDFTGNSPGVFTITRGTPASGIGPDTLPQNLTVANAAVFTGAELQAPSSWINHGVGYGVQTEPEGVSYLAGTNDIGGAAWTRIGVSVSGDVITATSANGVLEQAYSGAPAAGVFSVWLEPTSSAHTIELSGDGSIWEEVTINPSGQFFAVSASASGVARIRLANAGDSVRARFPALMGTPSSWINVGVTAPQTRNRTVVELSDASIAVSDGFAVQMCATPMVDRTAGADADPVWLSLASIDGTSGTRVRQNRGTGLFTIDWWTPAGGTVSTDLIPVDTVSNEAVVILVHKSPAGLACSINGATTTNTDLTDPAPATLRTLRLGSDYGTTAAAQINVQWIRLDPTGVPLDEAEAWAVWAHPAPVARVQPESIHFGPEEVAEPVALAPLAPINAVAGTPVALSVSASGSQPFVVLWEVDPNDGGGLRDITTQPALNAQNATTVNPTITLPATPGVYSYRVTVDNAAAAPQQSASTLNATVESGVPMGRIIALYTDIINGVNNGWHDDPTKGAVVTLFGAGFGEHPDTSAGSAILMGPPGNRVAVPSSHIVEWNVQAAPAYVPRMRMIVFHVPDASHGIPLGAQEIVITRNDPDDTEATETLPLPFFVRETGRIMYFDADNGDSPANGATGTYSNPFDQLGFVFNGANAGQYGLPGDHYYMLQGVAPYAPAGGSHSLGGSGDNVLYLTGRSQPGTVDNAVSISAYPGHNLVTFKATVDGARCMTGFEGCDYYVVSKISGEARYATCTPKGANDVRIVAVKGDGVHLPSSGTGDFGFSRTGDADNVELYKNNNIKFYGCESSGGTSLKQTDHAFYPGAGCFDYPGFEIAYCHVHSNDYSGGALISINWESGANGPRVVDGYRVQAMAIHHNIVDLRSATSSILHTGIGINGLQDTRPPDRLPQTGEKFSGRVDMHHNLFIGDTAGTVGNTNFSGINIKCTAINCAITNNTFYNIPNARALTFTTPSNADDGEYDPETGVGVDPSYSPYYETRGNMFVQNDPDTAYVTNYVLPDNRYTFVASNNVYAGGRNTGATNNYMLNDLGYKTADDNAGLTIGLTPGAATISLAADSIARDAGANFGLAAADLNNKPYTAGGDFPAGAVQAEDE